MNENKINKEPEHITKANDKGVNSTDLLGLKASIYNENEKLKSFLKKIDSYKRRINNATENTNSSLSNLRFVECCFSTPFVILAILQIACISLLLFQIFY